MTNDTNQDTYVKLEQLESMFSEPGYTYLGHGTGRSGNNDQVIDSIFENGLRTKDNSLYYTSIGLSVPSPEIKESYREAGIPEPTIDALKESFNNWQHQDSKKVIIMRLPTEYINMLGNRSDLDGEMFGAFYNELKQNDGKSINYLDPKFIVGCFDVDKQAVRLNHGFEKNLSPESIEKLKEGYNKAVSKTEARLKREEQDDLLRKNQLGEMMQEFDNQQTNEISDSYGLSDFDWDDNIEWNDTNESGIQR